MAAWLPQRRVRWGSGLPKGSQSARVLTEELEKRYSPLMDCEGCSIRRCLTALLRIDEPLAECAASICQSGGTTVDAGREREADAVEDEAE